MSRRGPIDLYARASEQGVDLDAALRRLISLYAEVDGRNIRNRRALAEQGLELPCQQGCSDCCHESVFLTELEFYGAWLYLQENEPPAVLDAVVEEGLAIFAANRALIESFNDPPPEGHEDDTALHMQLRFRCPLLDEAGGCRVYPLREMLGRLFGCSFNEAGGIYGCHLVGAALADQTVTLIRARPMAQRVHELPLTEKQQVYPWYIHQLYG